MAVVVVGMCVMREGFEFLEDVGRESGVYGCGVDGEGCGEAGTHHYCSAVVVQATGLRWDGA